MNPTNRMDAARTLMAVLVVLLYWVRTAAAGSDPQAVLDALPTEAALGHEWKREIGLLFDPLSKPPEILQTTSPLPESFKKERRAGVEDPKAKISGWSHTHFILQRTNAARRYVVQIERYRDKERLTKDFEQLLSFDSEQYLKDPIKALGDAAVFYRHAQFQGATLWFRRGNFKVWIDPMGNVTNWQQDTNLEHLAKTLDQQIIRGSTISEKLPQTGGPQSKP